MSVCSDNICISEHQEIRELKTVLTIYMVIIRDLYPYAIYVSWVKGREANNYGQSVIYYVIRGNRVKMMYLL